MPKVIQPARLSARRIRPACTICAGRRDDFDHAGAQVTAGRRGPLHRAARKLRPTGEERATGLLL